MKQYKKSQMILLDVESASEMATYLEALRGAAVIYCEHHCPEEVIYNSKSDRDVTHVGLVSFLNRSLDY